MTRWAAIADELGDSGFQRVLGCNEIVALQASQSNAARVSKRAVKIA